ncbi:polysaccharide biosynthesis C-terminal domain-containing protein [Cohnella boryungensis]|uniref:Polysaccharide biosynthesis C-terminal domain-containing protein n=1 Tax=Cohnella boryungensis TaxID=768479 RepID=A0ABV8S9C0_9BACL
MINKGSGRFGRLWLDKITGNAFLMNILGTFSTRIFLILIGLVGSVLVARSLGPSGRGLVAVASTIGAIGIQFGNLGLHASNTYYVAKDKKLLNALLGNSFVIALGVCGTATFMVYLVFTLWPKISPIQGTLLVMSLISVPLGLLYLLLQNLLIGINEIKQFNLIEVVSKIFYTLAILLVIGSGWISANTIYVVVLATSVIGILWAWLVLKRHLSSRLAVSKQVFNQTFQYGIKAYVVALLSFLVLKVDLLMIQYLLDTESTGYYSIALTLADYVYMLPVVVGTILFPKLAAIESVQERWAFTAKILKPFTLFMVVFIGVTAIMSKPLILLLFGEEFISSLSAFLWLLPGILFLSINTILMNYFASLGMPKNTIYSTATATVANIIFNFILLPEYGIIGASISSVICYGLMLIFSVVYLYSQKKLGERHEIK